jgi:hypothetical protein
MLLSIFRDQRGISLLIFNRNTVIFEDRAVSQPTGTCIELYLFLILYPDCQNHELNLAFAVTKLGRSTGTNRIKIAFKAVRMEVNLFLEQSLIFIVKQLSRQSVLIGIKRFGRFNNRECSAVDQCDRDLFT